jgi:hypothetical protein
MFNPPPNPLPRLLTPRVFFYVFLTLVTAWLMHRYNKYFQEAGRAAPVSEEARTEPQPLLFKESELSAPSSQKKPMLILFSGPKDDLTALRQALQQDFRETCSVIQLDAGNDASALEFFRVTKTPSILLFDTDNQELARKEDDIQLDSISTWLTKQLLKQQAEK